MVSSVKSISKKKRILATFVLILALLLGLYSVAFADEESVAWSKSESDLEACAEGTLKVRDFNGGDPQNSVIRLNESMLKVRAIGYSGSPSNIRWSSDDPNKLRVSYGISGGYANNSECSLIPGGDSGWCNITVSDGKESFTFKILVQEVDITQGYKWNPIASCTYTGKPCKPSIVIQGYVYEVISGNVHQRYGTLKEGVDYTVVYQNNVKVGTATAIVKGINMYTGEAKIHFRIVAAPTTPPSGDSTGSSSGSSDSSNSSNSSNQSGIANDAGASVIKPQAKPKAPVVSGSWKKSNGRWWFSYDSTTRKAQANKKWPVNEWVTIKGQQYHFNNSGYMNSGWFKSGSVWYYLGADGAMKTGWQKVKNKWYYLASDGTMQVGKKLINNKIYFLTSSGVMKTGWNKEGSYWYYYTSSGTMKTGWQKVGMTWYYLNPANGRMKTGFYDVSGKRYYSNSSGAMKTGWQKLSGKWYRFNASGAMNKGWAKVGGKWYYLNPADGVMKTGFYDVSGKRYYSNSSGAMTTGWQKVSNKWYYFSSSGAMQKDRWIGNYFVGSDGAMLTNTWIGKYHVNGSGKWDSTR